MARPVKSAPAPTDAFDLVERAAPGNLDALLGSSPVAMIVTLAGDGRIVKANDAFLDLYGLARHETIGRSALDLSLLADPSQRDQIVAAIRADALARTFEVDVLTRFGEPRRVLLWAQNIVVAEIPCLLTQMFDVTERHEEPLPAWHGMDPLDLLRATIDSAAEGIVVQDAEGQIVLANPSAERMLGLTTRQMRKRTGEDPIWRATREDGVPLAFEEHPVEITRRTGEPRTDEVMIVHAGERPPIWVSVTTRPLHRPSDGAAAGVVASFFDLTERVRAANELAEQQHALILLKDEFVSTVSHELRTPLTAIAGFADLLLESGQLPSALTRPVEIILDNAERLTMLLKDLLEISRLEANAADLDRRAVDVIAAIERVAETFKPLLKAKRQTLTVAPAPDLPPAWADPRRLAQILTNLLSNAHHYTGAGGAIEAAASVEDGWLRVRIADNGVGLTPEEQARLFNRFYRAGTRTEGGTGLGLSITKALVELHGGMIDVTSAPGVGSTFSFTLPLADPDALTR